MPVRTSEPGIAGKQRRIQCLSERNIRTVVRGHGLSKLPDTGQQLPVRMPLYNEPGMIIESLLCAGTCSFLEVHQSAQCLSNFHIDQMGCMHTLLRSKRLCFDGLGAIGS